MVTSETTATAEGPQVDRILVIRLGALGDVVRTLPAASRLRRRYPGAHLAWLVERKAAVALEERRWIDEVLLFPRESLESDWRERRLLAAGRTLRHFVAGLRARRFDLVLDFHAILKSGLLAAASGAPIRAGFARSHAREGAWLFSNRHVRLAAGPRSRFERNDALVRSLGIDTDPLASPIALESGSVQRIHDALGGDRGRVAAVHPGSSAVAAYKRWSPTGYAGVARWLRQSAGLVPLVIRGPSAGEVELAQRVVDASGGEAVLAPDTPRFDDLAALLAQSRIFIGTDSGPAHVASLVGTPVVQIIGPTHPVENAPWPGTPSRQVRVPVACSPCRRGCAAATCMRVIPSEAVVSAARDLLARQGGGRSSRGDPIVGAGAGAPAVRVVRLVG